MTIKDFKTSNQAILNIADDEITVTNKFGDTYRGRLENGKVVAKTAKALSYLTQAHDEFKMLNN